MHNKIKCSAKLPQIKSITNRLLSTTVESNNNHHPVILRRLTLVSHVAVSLVDTHKKERTVQSQRLHLVSMFG